ncbi:MAG TPA: dihydrodipicolinate synthase family protein [Oceanospirillaceae bacterium]|nr:dihydrodipicolinate synthase family protein [Oceanospirillaceae bacterium]
MSNLAGINLAMQTPFQADGGIDLKRWRELIDLYIDAGMHGLVLGSGTGQHPYLTAEECRQLYVTGMAHIDGRCNVICQTSALNMDDLSKRCKEAEDLGAQALMILPPYIEGPTDDDGILAFYEAIDGQINTDIVGYNIPQATGLSVSPQLLSRLAELPNFNYIKDSSGDMNVHQDYLQVPDIKVLNGADPIAIFSFMAGSFGAIWGCANYMPAECVKIWQLVNGGDHAAALALWQKMIPSIIWLWSNDYIAAIKSAGRMRGFAGGGVRAPLRPISQADEQALAVALNHLDN